MRMIGFCPLASGSKGNALYFGTPGAKILIDAGISAKQIKLRLAEIEIDIEEIDAILITHEHSDHIKALPQLACKMGIPVFCNSETAKAILPSLPSMPSFKIFTTGEEFSFADMVIHPFSIQHDTVDPVAFTIQVEGIKVGICTDLGFATTLVQEKLKGCDYLLLESNHDVNMVHASPRSYTYKQRVLSRQGHLSNEQCAALLEEIICEKLKHIHLAHLSSECNAEKSALHTISSKLESIGKKTEVSIAYQDKISKPIIFE